MTSRFVDLWDKAADSWNDFVETGKDVYKDLVIAPATLGLVPSASLPGQKALDLCCGEGYYSRRLKALGYDVYGVDISERMIELARRKARDITYVCSDASNLGVFADGSIDLTVCGMALMDAPNWEEIVREVYRVLKHDGQFIFSILHPCFSFVKGGWHHDENGEKLCFKMGNYFVEGEAIWEWNMPELKYPFRTKTFHRTLSTYYNALVSTGFVVEGLVEPHVDSDVGDQRIVDSGRVPYFIIFECRKRGWAKKLPPNQCTEPKRGSCGKESAFPFRSSSSGL
jgi:ubiquinone/menaquinone biosynthesis C-methylase UbiE